MHQIEELKHTGLSRNQIRSREGPVNWRARSVIPLGEANTEAMRILIADDHEAVRKGVRALLERQPNWEVIAEVATGREAVAEAALLKPDIVIMDIAMRELNGIDATAQIVAAQPGTPILLYSVHATAQLLRDAIVAGARGYVLKSGEGAELISGVKALAAGQPFFSGRLTELMLNEVAPGRVGRPVDNAPRLTPREREILRGVAEGATTRELAALLHVSRKTVETHRANILKKLKISSTAELVRYAIRNRIIEP